MFPDLRLLISATVAAFFLAATAGLYASVRITPDQITTRSDSRGAIEDTPIARISSSWPAPEPGRTAALWELTKIAKSAPIVASDESADVPEHGDIDIPDSDAKPETPAAIEVTPAQNTTGSIGSAAQPEAGIAVQPETGIAVQPETGSVHASVHPDIAGNIGEAPEIGNATPGTRKTARPAAKKVQPVAKKRPARIVRRKQIAHTPEYQIDPLLKNGYPLYLTVPVYN
jgi:hypothetical protein